MSRSTPRSEGAGRAPRGTTVKWSRRNPSPGRSWRLAVAARTQEAREEVRGASGQKGRTTAKEATIQQNSGRGAGGPNRSAQRRRQQEVPAPPSGARTSPAPAATPRHLFSRARGSVHPPGSPPHTLREGEGREEPRPWTRSLRAPPPAVPDINCGSLSPLLGGGEDDTRPATFPLLGSRRSGSRPLPGAARCRLDFSPAAAAAAAEGGPVPAPALLLRPSPQRVQATAR